MNRRFVFTVLPMIFFIGLVMIFMLPSEDLHEKSHRILEDRSNELVQVDFFVMSRCPDAAFCETLFLPYLLQLSSIVKFTLSFIASKSSANEFQCMHGESECRGNKQQLCIQKFYSSTIFLNYLLCQSADISRIPDNGEECARNLTINWSDVQTCVNSNQSNELFDQAWQRTQAAGARKSCTMHLNGKFWCMHDRYWANCSEGTDAKNFIKAICSRYGGKTPPKECTTN